VVVTDRRDRGAGQAGVNGELRGRRPGPGPRLVAGL